MKTKSYLAALFGGLVFFSTLTLFADNDNEAKREMLSLHETIAEYQGLHYHLCRGRTTACPEKCGDSGEFATFKIVKYLNYKKPGEYGDPKQASYRIQVSDFNKNPISGKYTKQVTQLKKGDRVLLSWRHDYVTTKGGSKFPDRVVSKLQKTE
ncbi:MAG: hypothetical protein KJO79_03505 [Verrucomicrobiae bacterium]|nr:hypothetical protein [Verrucomicrobiae bacterium]NNJ86223.1 hypothetical protein [Akkermansiaceae bacterium]